ncbi:MAG: biopolymer transporter ExbD [Verrucomicrobiota bacterium]
MKFTVRKKRMPPAVIIISLIDVLIVVLIFLMVTTTFKQQPAVKLALPESKESKPGSNENKVLVVTVSKEGIFYFGGKDNALTSDQLQERLKSEAQKNPTASLAIRADTAAPFGQIVKVMDAAKAANIKVASAYTKSGAQP